MSSGLLEVMKLVSKQERDSEQPTDLRIGTVTSVNPLKVQISTQLTIPSSLLVVPKHLTDYEVNIEINGGSKQKMKVYNALKKNDKVALLRKAGGQQFFILDRI